MKISQNTIRFFYGCCLLLFAGATVSVDAKIVFCVDGDIFVMNDDGSSRRRLTKNTQARDSHPRWSPDGRWITFERFIPIKNGINPKTIYVMSADGQQRPVLRDPPLNGPPTFRFHPRWSVDGQRILFYESKWFGEQDKRSIFV